MAPKYTSQEGLVQFLNGVKYSWEDGRGTTRDSRQQPVWETLTKDQVDDVYYLAFKGLVEGSLSAVVNDGSNTPLILTTDYTIDYAIPAITLTAAGIIKADDNDVKGKYKYFDLGLDKDYTEGLLTRAEGWVENECETVFAKQDEDSPVYNFTNGEPLQGQGSIDNLYSVSNYCLVKLQTTVNGAYTTGSTEITLTDSTGFPSTGTIYIGGNEVSYTAINYTTHIITVPSTTPSIVDTSVVRGEIIKVSNDGQGTVPTFTILTPGSDYEIDYDTGEIQLMNGLYNNYVGTASQFYVPQEGVQNRLQASYFHAFHEVGKTCSYKDDLLELIYMVAANFMDIRMIRKAVAQLNSTRDITGLRFSKETINELLVNYKLHNISRTV